MSDDSNRPAVAPPSRDALPPGTRFGEFEILRVLGVGGFGVVYLANDYSLERQVALKEYMPASLAVRGEGAKITIRSEAYAETYAMGLRSFINEARLLAKFDHPSLVKVYRFWEDNATAYMVMPYLQGTTLRDKRKTMGAAPKEVWIRQILDPTLDALEQLHGEGVYHRDVAPDNIFLPTSGGAPILLDFGAARRVISDRTQSLTAILKPSYAPIEQYAEMTGMRQGAWTDLYALGAVMHFLLFGQPPPPSTARAVQDDATPIDQRRVPGISPHFISVVAWMLGVRPIERPQSVAAVRAALRGEVAVPVHVRRDVTVPGNTALLSVATPAPFDKTLVDPAYQPTMRVGGSYDATLLDTAHQPTRLDTAHQPTRVDTAHQPTRLETAQQRARLDPAHQPTVLLSRTRPADASAPSTPGGTAPARALPPVAAPRGAPAIAAPAGGRKAWLIAGAAVVLVVAALAAWQFARPARSPAPGPTAQTAPQAAPVVATPDVGPTVANVASVPQWGGAASAAKVGR